MERNESNENVGNSMRRIKCLYWCWEVQPESYYKYYTYLLIFGHMVDLLYYGVLIFHGVLGHRLFSLIYHTLLLVFLLYSYRQYTLDNDYGQNAQYYYSKVLYYFSILLWILTFMICNVLVLNGKYNTIIHRKLYVYHDELTLYLFLIYIIFFPLSLCNLHLKRLYYQVIREQRQIDGKAGIEESNSEPTDSLQESLI